MPELKEPGADAEPWAWSAYFDDQVRLIREDLRAEGVSFAKLEAEWRRRWRKREIGADERRQRAFNIAYFRELTPTGDDPSGPCQCGDRVFFQLAGQSRWRCRTCDRVDAGLKVERWLVTPAGRAVACAHCGAPIHAGEGCTPTRGGAVLHNRCVDAWSRA
jgi:hypothetical protein